MFDNTGYSAGHNTGQGWKILVRKDKKIVAVGQSTKAHFYPTFANFTDGDEENDEEEDFDLVMSVRLTD